jgi:hypothetical protein
VPAGDKSETLPAFPCGRLRYPQEIRIGHRFSDRDELLLVVDCTTCTTHKGHYVRVTGQQAVPYLRAQYALAQILANRVHEFEGLKLRGQILGHQRELAK